MLVPGPEIHLVGCLSDGDDDDAFLLINNCITRRVPFHESEPN